MNSKLKVEVAQETYANYKVIMGYFRLVGLLPVKVQKSTSEIVLEFSPLYLTLWGIFAVFMILTTLWGMVADAKTKSASIQLEADTDKLMVLMQAAQYSAVVVVGTIINPCRLRKLFSYITCVNQIDSVIKTSYESADKYKILLMASLIILYNLSFGSFFLYSCYVVFGDNLGLIEVLKRFTSLQIVAYSAWVSEYMNLVMLKSLETRIKTLNGVLVIKYHSFADANFVGNQTTFRHHTQAVPKVPKQKPNNLRVVVGESVTVTTLTKVYVKILNSADTLNDFLNLGFLVTTAAAFWSLIYILYFSMLTLTHKRGDQGRATEVVSSFVQLFAHTVRALMIVNPAHDCLTEIERTKAVVCRMLACNLTQQCRRDVDCFSLVLGLRQLQFSACGFLTVDRFLFVSVVDTITTILMVLYQYRSSFEIDF